MGRDPKDRRTLDGPPEFGSGTRWERWSMAATPSTPQSPENKSPQIFPTRTVRCQALFFGECNELNPGSNRNGGWVPPLSTRINDRYFFSTQPRPTVTNPPTQLYTRPFHDRKKPLVVLDTMNGLCEG